MRIRIFFFAICFLFYHKIYGGNSEGIPVNQTQKYTNQSTLRQYANAFPDLLSVDFEDSNVVSKKTCTRPIDNLGDVQFLEVALLQSWPYNRYFLFFISKDRGRLYWLNADTFMFFKTRFKSSAYLIGCIIESRGYGYLHIYDFEKGSMTEILDTKSYCDGTGKAVINATSDCVSYKGFNLTPHNVDLNNDSIRDISFSGLVNYYCEGFESGMGYEVREPFESKKVNIKLICEKKPANHYAWKIVRESEMCKILSPEARAK